MGNHSWSSKGLFNNCGCCSNVNYLYRYIWVFNINHQDSALKHELHLSKIENIESRKTLIEDEIESMNTRVRTLVESRQSQEARLDGISTKLEKP